MQCFVLANMVTSQPETCRIKLHSIISFVNLKCLSCLSTAHGSDYPGLQVAVNVLDFTQPT